MKTHHFTLTGFSGIMVGIISIISSFLLQYFQVRHLSGNMDIAVLPISYFELFQLFLLTLYVVVIYFVVKKINKKFFKKKNLETNVLLNKKIRNRIIWGAVLGFVIALFLFKINYFRLVLPMFCLVYGMLRLLLYIKLTVGHPWLGYLFVMAGFIAYLIPSYDLIIWGSCFGGVHLIYGIITLSRRHNLVNS